MALELPEAVLGTLQEGRQAYVAVDSKNGPHVTPEVYTWSDGRLWFAAASTTLKAKVLAERPGAGAVVNVGGRTVMLAGQVAGFDPRDVRGLADRTGELPAAARAMGRFTVRNAPDLLAFFGDAVTGKLGQDPPPLRVLFALERARAALVENDAVAGCWGWSGDPGGNGQAPPAGGERAVAALPGPVAVPARWFADDRRLHVPPPLLGMLGLDDGFPLGVVVDDYTAPGPAAKQGVLLRGRGRLADPAAGVVEVRTDRVVEWDGIETSSHDAG